MNVSPQNPRATKKQHELLSFIDGFIKGNGYGPSYREVMRALEYKSVSTVAAHINSLISKGYLEKTDTSARSLRMAHVSEPDQSHSVWLRQALRQKRTTLRTADTAASREQLAAIDTVAQLFDITL